MGKCLCLGKMTMANGLSLVGPLVQYIQHGFYSHDQDMTMPLRMLSEYFHQDCYTRLENASRDPHVTIDDRDLYQCILFMSSLLYHAFSDEDIAFFSTHKYIEIMDYEHLWHAFTKARDALPSEDKEIFMTYLEDNLKRSPLREANDTFYRDTMLKEIIRVASEGVFDIDLETDFLTVNLD